MKTAIIGLGNIGRQVALNLIAGGGITEDRRAVVSRAQRAVLCE